MASPRRRFVGFLSRLRGSLPASVNDSVFALPVRATEHTPELCRVRGWPVFDLGPRVQRLPDVLACTDPTLHDVLLAGVFGFAQERRMFAAVIPDGRVHSHACSAIAPGGTVLADVSPHAGVPIHLHRALSGSVVARSPRRLAGRSALIGGTGHRNFFHWLFDSLPRIGLVRDAGMDGIDRWIVPATELGVARELLARAGIPPDRLEPIGRRDHVVCDELVVTSAPGEICEPTPRSVDFLRKVLPSDRGRIEGKRVYISRSGRRRVANEADLGGILGRFGFRRVAMEGLALDDQIEAVAGAEVILAPHGAALSHMVHASDGAMVIECMPPCYRNVSFFVLAGACGFRYGALSGEGRAVSAAAANASDFLVNPESLERTLAAALGSDRT